MNVQKITKYNNKHTQVLFPYQSVPTSSSSSFDAICTCALTYPHDNQWHLLSLSADRAQRYIVFVPGESYFGYIADAFLRAELCPHPPHTLPALVNAVSSWLSHISPRRRAHAAQIQRCRRAPDSLGLSEHTVR